jgi:WD40 repeat protein
MCRFLTPFLCLLFALLPGCLSAPTAGEAEDRPIPELSIVGSADLFSSGVDFLALSEDGNTFVAGNEYHSVGLYRTSDYTRLEEHYDCDDEFVEIPNTTDSCRAKASTLNAGYIDVNTWYFTTMLQRGTGIRLHVRTIQPSREISVSEVNEDYHNAAASVNKNYIAYNNWLIDWRTGESHRVKGWVFDPQRWITPTLTPDNRIITYPNKETYSDRKTVIFDPLNDTMEVWKEATQLDKAIIVTPDNRHAIGLSTKNYKCTLWSWPERKEIGHCSGRLRGIFGKYPEYLEVLALSLDSKRFAIGVENNVRVYRIEPFQLEMEANTPGPVGALAFSDDGWLAASDRKGFLRVWDVDTGSLAGQRRFSGDGLNEKYVPKLVFQPNSNKLFTTYGGITVFEIPKQATK